MTLEAGDGHLLDDPVAPGAFDPQRAAAELYRGDVLDDQPGAGPAVDQAVLDGQALHNGWKSVAEYARELGPVAAQEYLDRIRWSGGRRTLEVRALEPDVAIVGIVRQGRSVGSVLNPLRWRELLPNRVAESTESGLGGRIGWVALSIQVDRPAGAVSTKPGPDEAAQTATDDWVEFGHNPKPEVDGGETAEATADAQPPKHDPARDLLQVAFSPEGDLILLGGPDVEARGRTMHIGRVCVRKELEADPKHPKGRLGEAIRARRYRREEKLLSTYYKRNMSRERGRVGRRIPGLRPETSGFTPTARASIIGAVVMKKTELSIRLSPEGQTIKPQEVMDALGRFADERVGVEFYDDPELLAEADEPQA